SPVHENGKEVQILRDNHAVGRVGEGEFGTYFIGYCRTPRIIEQMIENMFVGRPPGNYDRLLDFSRAVTGTLFFVPSATFLENVAAALTAPSVAGPGSAEPVAEDKLDSRLSSADGSLGIGSLKTEGST